MAAIDAPFAWLPLLRTLRSVRLIAKPKSRRHGATKAWPRKRLATAFGIVTRCGVVAPEPT